MDLQADDAGRVDLLVLLGVVDGQRAVEPQPDRGPSQRIVYSFQSSCLTSFSRTRPSSGRRAPCSAATRRRAPPVALADVGLVADDLVVLRDALGAELDAGVGLVLVAEELELDLQLEVAVGLGGAEELVARHDRVERPADDGAVLDPPGLLCRPPSRRGSCRRRATSARRRGAEWEARRARTARVAWERPLVGWVEALRNPPIGDRWVAQSLHPPYKIDLFLRLGFRDQLVDRLVKRLVARGTDPLLSNIPFGVDQEQRRDRTAPGTSCRPAPSGRPTSGPTASCRC